MQKLYEKYLLLYYRFYSITHPDRRPVWTTAFLSYIIFMNAMVLYVPVHIIFRQRQNFPITVGILLLAINMLNAVIFRNAEKTKKNMADIRVKLAESKKEEERKSNIIKGYALFSFILGMLSVFAHQAADDSKRFDKRTVVRSRSYDSTRDRGLFQWPQPR